MGSGAQIIRNYTSEFSDVGTIYFASLNDIVANIDINPTSEELLDFLTAYFYNTYFSGRSYESIPRESVKVIASRSLNVNSKNFNEYLSSLNVSKESKVLLEKVFRFPSNLIKYSYTSDKIIFNHTLEASGVLNDLINEVQNSKIPIDQKILPNIALVTLQYTFSYWNYVYTNYGGSNAWYTYLLTTVGGFELNEIDWVKVFESSMAGSICGAVNGFVNQEDFQSISISAAIGASISSCNEVLVQIFNHLQITDGLLTGGEEVEAKSGNNVFLKKHIVNITSCKTGEGVTLPRAKSGNLMFIKNSTASNVLIAPKSTDTIDGSSSYVSLTAGDIGQFCSAENGKWITGN